MRPFYCVLGLGALGLMSITFLSLVGIAGTVIWIWMLVEVLLKETDEGNNRLIWTLVILLTHWLGALIYLIARRSERIKKLGK